jgi:hypothetical protein
MANIKIFDRKLFSLLVLLVLVGTCMLAIGPANSLDKMLYYTGDQARHLFDSFTEEERRSYFLCETFDLIFMAAYTAAMSLAVVRLFPGKPLVRLLAVLPGLCDVVETVSILRILRFNGSLMALDWLGIFTFSKWIFAAAALVTIAVGVKKRKRDPSI